ncbi:hypothetical protein [Asticcacaulis solisilvae]|uniref:hypothetical protein n=1 Tax=Asticcacaulis solisilvae TaxID=1217274 RepID=UPI003FD71EEA
MPIAASLLSVRLAAGAEFSLPAEPVHAGDEIDFTSDSGLVRNGRVIEAGASRLIVEVDQARFDCRRSHAGHPGARQFGRSPAQWVVLAVLGRGGR